METLTFIDLKYKTEAEKQRILQHYDTYQRSKLIWLNNINKSLSTNKGYISVYNNYIHDAEIEHEKDLKSFTKNELEDIIKECIDVDDRTRGKLGSFCSTYCQYCVSNGDIDVNQYTGISPSALAENIEYLKSRIFGKDKFDSIYKKMKLTTNFNYIKPLLLARYGVMGEKAIFMRSLKYKDIDTYTMEVIIRDEGNTILHKLPIDDIFIQLLNELNDVNDKNTDEDILKSDTYVLNKTGIMNYNTMHNNNRIASEAAGEDRISLGDLLFTRQIESLLKIRKKRKLTTDDLKDILKKFGYKEKNDINDNSIIPLKKSYEKLTGDIVVSISTVSNLNDSHSKEFAESKARELGLNIEESPIVIKKSLSVIDHFTNNFIDTEDSEYQDRTYAAYYDSDNDTSNAEFKRGEKKKPISDKNNKPTYPRDSKVALCALKLANYKCALDEKHETFISQTTSKNYVEVHHLIPIKYYDEFDADVDNVANIVVLCPNSHRRLHYGQFEDKEHLLEILYNGHIHNLKIVDLKIEKDELFAMYKNLFKKET